MADYSGKNKITLGLIDATTGDEYGTVEWTTGKGKTAVLNSDNISPDGSGWFIDAGSGDDLIDARLTNLRAEIFGGTGNDTIYGGTYGSSNPYSFGEGDYIDGGAGRDWIDAGTGNDVVVYDAYDQRVEGDGGFDTLDASGAASVRGKGVIIDLGSTRDIFSGFEAIIGSDYADTLTGNEASNFIDGGAGADIIRLGYGEDFAIYDANDILVDGGYDRDSIYGWDFSGPEGITLDLGTSTTWINFENVYGSEFADTLTGNSQDNSLEGGGGNDVLNGRAGNDFLTGGSGDDIIYGEDGNDDIYGGDGVDHLDGGAGNDYLSSGVGDDIIQGGAGSDQIYGEDGADQLNGGTGVDYIYGGYGADVIDGGEGADTVYAGFGDDMVIYDAAGYADGEDGIDTVNASTATEGVSINLNVSYVNFENIIGSAFDDTLVGQDSVNNLFNGGAGADNMDGGNGDDTFVIGGTAEVGTSPNYDSIVGGAGNDTVVVTADTNFVGVTVFSGIDVLQLSDGVDVEFDASVVTGTTVAVNGTGDNAGETVTLWGTNSADTMNFSGWTLDTNDISGLTINGMNGDDTITATNGEDTISGGVDADVITGGLEADTFVFNAGDSGFSLDTADTIADFQTGLDQIKGVGTNLVAYPVEIVDGSGLIDFEAFLEAANVAFGGTPYTDAFVAYDAAGSGDAWVLLNNDSGIDANAGVDTVVVLTGINLASEIAAIDFIS